MRPPIPFLASALLGTRTVVCLCTARECCSEICTVLHSGWRCCCAGNAAAALCTFAQLPNDVVVVVVVVTVFSFLFTVVYLIIILWHTLARDLVRGPRHGGTITTFDKLLTWWARGNVSCPDVLYGVYYKFLHCVKAMHLADWIHDSGNSPAIRKRNTNCEVIVVGSARAHVVFIKLWIIMKYHSLNGLPRGSSVRFQRKRHNKKSKTKLKIIIK